MRSLNSLLVSLCLSTSFLSKDVEPSKIENIVGGHVVEGNLFSSSVVVSIDSHHCGGGIIQPRYVVSVAHCFIDRNGAFYKKNAKVIAGVTNFLSRPKTRVEIDVSTIHIPDDYDRYSYHPDKTADIAVIKLRTALKLYPESPLKSLHLPRDDLNFIGESGIFVGYGASKAPEYDEVEDEPIIDLYTIGKSHYILVNVLNDTKCKRYNPDIKEGLFCAQVDQSISKSVPAGTCIGDSGSPLIYLNNILLGVLSASPRNCDESNHSGTYASVLFYKNFILTTIHQNCLENNMYCHKYTDRSSTP